MCIQVVPPMLWMPKRLPRNCSAVLRLGCASIVCVSLLEIDERIFKYGPDAAAPSTEVPPV